MKDHLEKIVKVSSDRFEFWINFVNEFNLLNVCEVGVYKGDFAKELLQACNKIKNYYMIDPWQHLENWNKPANKDDATFELFYEETINKTDFVKEKRIILRGKTQNVVNQIQDDSLDFAYIDGDHTLKGITIDLINIWNKIKPGGFIGGDDFVPRIWQHGPEFEPTLIFPFAVYFAEAMNTKIYALPFKQFLISKGFTGFEFIDLTKGIYRNTSLKNQFVK
jgi:hypothetical protein